MSLFKRGKTWWYKFWFAGRRLQESAKTASKTIAKLAEQKRRRELEEGFNRIEDHREEGIRTIRDVGKEYLDGYVLRNRSATFAEYAIGHVTRLLGAKMLVDVDEKSVLGYQAQPLREKAAPKTINDEVGFLLGLIGERGELVRAHLRKQKTLKIKGQEDSRKGLFARRKTTTSRGDPQRSIARDISSPDAGVKCWNAKRRDPELEMEPDRSQATVRHGRQEQDRSR